MSEIIIGAIATIASGFIGWYLGTRSEKRKTQLEMIMRLYPPLLEDLRLSMRECNSHFHSIYGIGGIWKILRRYFNDGTISAIEGYDKKLYDDLVVVNEQILPLIKNIEERQRNVVKIIQGDWKELFDDMVFMRVKADTEDIVRQLASDIIWEIWRGNLEEARQSYNLFIAERDKQIKYLANPPPESMFNKLVEIANSHMDKIKEEYKKVEKLFKEVIQNKIIPRMENTIKGQFD